MMMLIKLITRLCGNNLYIVQVTHKNSMVARHSSLELQLTNNYNVNETTSVPDVTSRLGVLDISQNLPISQFASGTRPGFC